MTIYGPRDYQAEIAKSLECSSYFELNKLLRTPSLIHFSLHSSLLQENQDELDTTQPRLWLPAGASEYKSRELQPPN